MGFCKHVADVTPPKPNQSVYREDCTQCFDSIDDPTGLNVCLYCFNGGCTGDRNHAKLHSRMESHPLALNIRRTRKQINRDEPPQKISKLEIAAETETDRYDTKTSVCCYECKVEDVDISLGFLSESVRRVMDAMTFARQEEVKAWEQEITPCEHTLILTQDASRNIESQDLGHCSMCDLKENLWLCLQCGNLGCGRSQVGGIGGHSHGLAHSDATHHPVAVKLGSITATGNADVYCYACKDERADLELAAHLAHWGINITEREKTEKSLTEMQIEHNLRWEFSMTTEDGKELRPICGKGLTGLKNLGNSCYLASTLQCLFALPQFQERYYHSASLNPKAHLAFPAEDLETQMRKLADGLLSGRYSLPDKDVLISENSTTAPYQKGLAPAMLKHLISRGHEEFSTMRQQDAFELLLYLFKLVTRSEHPSPLKDPTKSFRFVMEQRLQCLYCKKVRYRTDQQDNISIPVPARRIATTVTEDDTDKYPKFEPVTLKECLDIFTGEEKVELTCNSCGSKEGFVKSTKFRTFPEVLAVNARRFELVNWVPTKLDIPVVVGDEQFTLDSYRSTGLQNNEQALPDVPDVLDTPAFVPNAAGLEMLEGMGFPRVRCEKALHATGNSDVEAASNWLFAHMEDPDIDAPVTLSASAPKTGQVDQSLIDMLVEMGIPAPNARKALTEKRGDIGEAIEWHYNHLEDPGMVEASEEATPSQEVPGSDILPAKFQLHSIICHKGTSIHAGHYVAFIRKIIPKSDKNDSEGDAWVLFNDEKVVVASDVEEMKKFAYIYFFRRT